MDPEGSRFLKLCSLQTFGRMVIRGGMGSERVLEGEQGIPH